MSVIATTYGVYTAADESGLLYKLIGGNESIGGHARRLAAEYAPVNGSYDNNIANAASAILHHDRNAASNHHRSGAIKIVCEEMFRVIYQGGNMPTMKSFIANRINAAFGNNSTWTPDLIQFYVDAAAANLPVRQGVYMNPAFPEEDPVQQGTFGVSRSFDEPQLAGFGGNIGMSVIFGLLALVVLSKVK